MGIIMKSGISYCGGGSSPTPTPSVVIDDTTTSSSKVWSSQKTNDAINAAVISGSGYAFKPNAVTSGSAPAVITYDSSSAFHVTDITEDWYEDAGYYYLELHIEHDAEASETVLVPYTISGTYSSLAAYASQCSVALSSESLLDDIVNLTVGYDKDEHQVLLLGYVCSNSDDAFFDCVVKFPKFIT